MSTPSVSDATAAVRPLGAGAEVEERVPVGILGLDRILGGGLLPASVLLLAGDLIDSGTPDDARMFESGDQPGLGEEQLGLLGGAELVAAGNLDGHRPAEQVVDATVDGPEPAAPDPRHHPVAAERCRPGRG